MKKPREHDWKDRLCRVVCQKKAWEYDRRNPGGLYRVAGQFFKSRWNVELKKTAPFHGKGNVDGEADDSLMEDAATYPSEEDKRSSMGTASIRDDLEEEVL